MLAFNSNEFLYPPEDKDLGFSSSTFDDPTNDLFNQYISHDSPDPSDSVNKANGFQAFEFPLGDDIPFGGKALAEKAFNTPNHPTLRRSHRAPPKGLRCTQSQEILPSQTYHKFARFERPKAAISGLELLNLEGKLAPPRVPATTSFPPVSHPPVPPLRRKARFDANPPETLRHQHDKISKGPATGAGEASKMMRPSYYYRNEMPSFQEWSQELEQIVIQSPSGDRPMAASSSDGLLRHEKRPRNPPPSGSSHPLSRQQEIYHPNFRPMPGSKMPNIPERDALSLALASNGNTPVPQNVGLTSTEEEESSQPNMDAGAGMSMQPGPSPFWQASTSTDSFDCAIPPSQVQTSLLSASTCYYGNFEASQSAPVLSHARSSMDFSTHNFFDPDEPFNQFITEDPSHEYFIAPSDMLFSPTKDDDIYPPLPSSPTTTTMIMPPAPSQSQQRPRTPSSRSSSVGGPLSPPATSKSPSKPHSQSQSQSQSESRRRSKSSRRKGSAGALKSPTSSSSIDFVNFTPNDSRKILSGVAPSGSSKTKARREQEANDRKRKLSQAAEKAVKDAGGNVEQLRAAGIFVGLGE